MVPYIKTQCSDQVKIRSITQLITDILIILQKFRDFSGTHTSLFCVQSFPALPVIFSLYANE